MIEEAETDPVLTVKELRNGGRRDVRFNPATVETKEERNDKEEIYPTVPNPITVEVRTLLK